MTCSGTSTSGETPRCTMSFLKRGPFGRHPGDGEAAEEGGRDVVGVPLHVVREREQLLRVEVDDALQQPLGRHDAGDDRSTGGAQPPAVRDAVARDEVEPGQRDADRLEGVRDGPDDEVGLVGRRPRPRRRR